MTSRRHYPDKSVLIIRKEKEALVPCGIPYIFGTLGSCNKNIAPIKSLEKNDIEFVIDEVKDIQTQSKTITTKSESKIQYDRLVIATGSEPLSLQIPGSDKKGVYMIRNNIDYLQNMLKTLNEAKNVVIIGSGFIGVELADECKRGRDINIKIIARSKRCLRVAYDEDFSTEAESYLKEAGIEILTQESPEAFIGGASVEKVRLSSGKEIPADMIIFGIGSTANTKLAERAGLALGPTKGIKVNSYMQTSDPDIFACGDCAEKVSFFDGKSSKLKLASIAATEARIVGSNLFNVRRINPGVIGVYSTMLTDKAFSGAGLTESQAKAQGYDVLVGEANSPNRHPKGMKGMSPLKVKLVFDKDTQVLLGGQASGAKSAGELINTISACIQNKMTADSVAQFQIGTHPGLTASPGNYQLVNAAEMALMKKR